MFAFLNYTLFSALIACVAEALLPCKISFIVGSYAAFFSAGHCFLPLIGKYKGTRGSIYYYAFKTLIKALKAHTLSTGILVYHVPGFLGTLYASAQETAQRVSGPQALLIKALMSAASLGCMVLFGMHSTGIQAWPYTVLWLIPAIAPFMSTKQSFLPALASTLFAHAVGSVLWLYTNPMTPAVWLGLIPVVALERLFFALGAVAIEKTVQALSYCFNKSMLPSYRAL